MIYKKSIFQFKSKYVCEMMEGDCERKDCEFDVGEIGKISCRITRIESDGISMLEVSKFFLHHYFLMAKILIFMRYSVILDRPN